jgi:ABC-type transport system substrate-binding protein
MKVRERIVIVILSFIVLGCDLPVLNSPYPLAEKKKNVLFSSFAERPKTLDPAKAYSSNEYQFISQIYEPLLQYDYFKRPYQLAPLAAKELPKILYLDENFNAVDEDSNLIRYTRFEITIRQDLKYQPHPALAMLEGQPRYYPYSEALLKKHAIKRLNDFQHTGSRGVMVEDYIYQIKRLADKKIHSPIYGVMAKSIVGFREFSKELSNYQNATAYKKSPWRYPHEIEGVKKEGPYQLSLTVKGKNPEFRYWLAMPFFAAMPFEAVRFYSQPGFSESNLNLDWQPIGSGPFYLSINNPNQEMRLDKNPNFHQEFFPEPSNQAERARFAKLIGKPLPLLNQVQYVLEKESIPRWNKFLQGYFDSSGVSADSFDQAFSVNRNGEIELTPDMMGKGVKLYSAVEPTIFYMGFNMLDETVGGFSEKNRKLRQAISIAVDYSEYIAIFMNGRGLVAEGPIPPGIDGYQLGKKGINPYVFDWVDGHPMRKSIQEARTLLKEAGYPNGFDKRTNQPLILNYDVPASSSPDDKARLNWYRKQFRKLGISLNIRATQYNRFQEKMRNGNAQIFSWGWHADYPSSRNFLFLLNGDNGKVKYGGENAANYNSDAFNQLFQRYQQLHPGQEREALIEQMIQVAQRDAPWIWGVFPKSFLLTQQWSGPIKVSTIGNNTLKYQSLDPLTRVALQEQWNQPKLWPGFFLVLLLAFFLLPVLISYYQKEKKPIRRL